MCKRSRKSATVYLGLGSNIDPVNNLVSAVRELRRRYGVLCISPVYESAAVGFEGDNFLNLVVGLKSEETAAQICEAINAIHNLAGRDRGNDKWASRPLDIDLLLYNDLIEDRRPVRVPRSDVLDYSFVLRPLAELAPELRHPVTGRTMLQHWQEFDQLSHPLLLVDVDFTED